MHSVSRFLRDLPRFWSLSPLSFSVEPYSHSAEGTDPVADRKTL